MNWLSLGVLISGGGTTLRNLIKQAESGKLDVVFASVISSNPEAKGNDFAEQASIPLRVMEREDYDTPESYSEAIFASLRDAGVDLVVMAGFLKFVPIPDDFAGRVINIHPSLLPAFGGKGFYGERVHKAVLEQGAETTGCTVHFVDNVYDNGPIILQRSVDVLKDDTSSTLAARVFESECEALPEAIRMIAMSNGKLIMENGE